MSCYRSPTASGSNPVSERPCTAFVLGDGFTSCCDLSHAAQCMPSSLCYQPAWVKSDGTGSGWLAASCTDERYNSGACNRHCVDLPVPDVVYNNRTGLWACCGVGSNGLVDCNNPTSKTFQGEAPEVLLGTDPSSPSSSPLSSSTTTSSASASISTPDYTTSTTQSSVTVTAAAGGSGLATSSSSGLSTGAKAGIGVGVALGVIGIICIIIIMLMLRKRRRVQDLSSAATTVASKHEYTNTHRHNERPLQETKGSTTTVQELSGDGMRAEKGASERHELSS